MIYVIGGFLRTGTSMMMKALSHTGGLNAVFDPSLDSVYARQMNCEPWYDPNPGGFYECRIDTKQRGYVQQFRNKLVKVLRWNVVNLPKYNYKVVLMHRNPIEIDMSMKLIGQGLGQTPRLYQGYQDRIRIILENRSDVNLTVLDYGDVIDDPVPAFEILAANGFPIDPKLAATVVDDKLYRNRAE